MNVEVTHVGLGNGAAALTLVVALLNSLKKSGKLSDDEIWAIRGAAQALLPGDRSVDLEGRTVLKSIQI